MRLLPTRRISNIFCDCLRFFFSPFNFFCLRFFCGSKVAKETDVWIGMRGQIDFILLLMGCSK